MSFETVFLGIFALVGAIFAGIGLFMEAREKTFVRNAQPAQIEVVELHARRDSEGDTTYAPEFRVVSGPYEGRTSISSMSSRPARHAIGDRGDGLIDPETGRIAFADGSGARFAMAFSSLGLGLVGGFVIFLFRTSSS